MVLTVVEALPSNEVFYFVSILLSKVTEKLASEKNYEREVIFDLKFCQCALLWFY